MTCTHHHSPERICVGVDGSVASHAAVRWAIDHARSGDTVTLVHAWQTSPAAFETAGMVDPDDDSVARAFLRHELARMEALPRDPGVELVGEVVHGDPSDCLCAAAADLLVVGAGGHGRIIGALLGSVSASLAHHAHVPLVIVPTPQPARPSAESS